MPSCVPHSWQSLDVKWPWPLLPIYHYQHHRGMSKGGGPMRRETQQDVYPSVITYSIKHTIIKIHVLQPCGLHVSGSQNTLSKVFLAVDNRSLRVCAAACAEAPPRTR
jgi:hypothetical protein